MLPNQKYPGSSPKKKTSHQNNNQTSSPRHEKVEVRIFFTSKKLQLSLLYFLKLSILVKFVKIFAFFFFFFFFLFMRIVNYNIINLYIKLFFLFMGIFVRPEFFHLPHTLVGKSTFVGMFQC